MKLNPQIKYLLGALTFFVFSVACFLLLLREVNNNKKISDESELAWYKESTKRYDLNSLERSLKTIEKEATLLDSHFVHPEDIVSFLNNLERMGALVGVKAEILSVDQLTETEGTGLVLGIKTEGAFQATYKFLTLLENSYYEIDVFSVDIVRSGGLESKTATPTWNATFGIKLVSFIP